MPEATLTSKGQITIPRQIREHLQLKSGDRLAFEVDADGTVTIRPVTLPITVLKGLIRKPAGPVSVDDMNAAIRERASRQ